MKMLVYINDSNGKSKQLWDTEKKTKTGCPTGYGLENLHFDQNIKHINDPHHLLAEYKNIATKVWHKTLGFLYNHGLHS